ncbi:MAG: hypothetical protein ACOY99_00605 [Pseudomonadota bacterium]
MSSTLLLAAGLGLWWQGLQRLRGAGRSIPSSADEAMGARLFSLTQRIDHLLTADWLDAPPPLPVKRRLKAALASWREELMTDFPVAGSALAKPAFARLARHAQAALARLEALQFDESADSAALEEAERRLLSAISQIGGLASKPPR